MKVQMGKQGKKSQKLIVIVTYSKALSPCFPFWVNFIFEMAKQKCFYFWFSTYLLNFKKEVKKRPDSRLSSSR
jgi:hypothetical protein